jgi:hypothetical protein
MSVVSFRSLVRALVLVIVVPMGVQAQASLPSTPTAAVEEFMRAASDSNLTRMSQLFGSDGGSAASTNQPKDHGQRMIIMQAYLGGISVRALGDVVSGDKNRRLVTTEISRGPCRVVVPVTVVQVRGGWLVNAFDLSEVAQVNKPCDGTGGPGNS